MCLFCVIIYYVNSKIYIFKFVLFSYICIKLCAMNALDMVLYKSNIIIIILFGYFELL